MGIAAVGVAMAVAIALLHGNLDGDLLGDLVALLNRHALALLVISVAVALLLVSDVARRLIDGIVVGLAGLLVLGLVGGVVDRVALLLVDGLVGCLVGGVALGVRLVAVAVAAVRLRSSGRKADN